MHDIEATELIGLQSSKTVVRKLFNVIYLAVSLQYAFQLSALWSTGGFNMSVASRKIVYHIPILEPNFVDLSL